MSIESSPRSYSVADYEFLKVPRLLSTSPQQPRAVSDAHYVHFAMDAKPWESSYGFEVLPALTEEAAALMAAWKDMASGICGFRPENGGWPADEN